MVGGGSKGHDLRTEAHGKFGPTLCKPSLVFSGYVCLCTSIELDPHFPERHHPGINEPLASGLRLSCFLAASNMKALLWATEHQAHC